MEFTIVDLNVQRVAAWSSDDLPIYEPVFDEVEGVATRTCSFSTYVLGAIKEAGIIVAR